MYHIYCPGCGVALKVSEEMVGRKAQCNQCTTLFSVPAQASQPTTVVPATPTSRTAPAIREQRLPSRSKRYEEYEDTESEQRNKGSSTWIWLLVALVMLLFLAGGGGMVWFYYQQTRATAEAERSAEMLAQKAFLAEKDKGLVLDEDRGGDKNKIAKPPSGVQSYAVFLESDPKGIKKTGYHQKRLFFQANMQVTIRVTSDANTNIDLYLDDPLAMQIAADTSPGKDCFLQARIPQSGEYTITVDNLGPLNTNCILTVTDFGVNKK